MFTERALHKRPLGTMSCIVEKGWGTGCCRGYKKGAIHPSIFYCSGYRSQEYSLNRSPDEMDVVIKIGGTTADGHFG